MEIAPNFERLSKLAEQGVRVDALEKRPRIRPTDRRAWALFAELSATRPAGMSACAIPFPHFVAACDVFEIPQRLRRWYWRVIRVVDAAYLEARNNANSSDHDRRPQG